MANINVQMRINSWSPNFIYYLARLLQCECGDKVEEDVVAVCPLVGAEKSYLQFIQTLKDQPLTLVLEIPEGGLAGQQV